MTGVKPRDALHRIRVTGVSYGTESLRCFFGWHRVRFFPEPDDHWRPRCSRCRRIAYWWQAEGRPVTRLWWWAAWAAVALIAAVLWAVATA